MKRLWHNPRCSKSRAALAIVQAGDEEVEVYRYLDTPPDEAALDALLGKLGIPLTDLVRKGEAPWREAGESVRGDELALKKLVLSHPILIERPILETDDDAVIGRPPEDIERLL